MARDHAPHWRSLATQRPVRPGPMPAGRTHRGQYGSRQCADVCDELGVTRSMGAVGTSADNAACESFHASLKRETLKGPGGVAMQAKAPQSHPRQGGADRHDTGQCTLDCCLIVPLQRPSLTGGLAIIAACRRATVRETGQ